MEDINRFLPTKLVAESSIYSKEYDCLFLVHWPEQNTKETFISDAIETAFKIDPSLESEVAILPLPSVPSGRLIYAPTGVLNEDYDDVRSLSETAAKGIQKAINAGLKKPLILLKDHTSFTNAKLVTLLGALEAAYVTIQAREGKPNSHPKLDCLGVFTENLEETKKLISLASILESGLYVARDIGGADPERMSPPKIQEYVEDIFKNSNIKITTIDDVNQISKEYPLFEAVNRGASDIKRHRGRIMFLEYDPKDESKVKDTLFFVGKGVTYDTGGVDVKINGGMRGMCRDKCGAAAVVGFLKIVASLQPDDVKVVAAISLVRNSIGSNSYVSDELIKARSGVFVRVVNTDAEGRMVMADVLCKLKEQASKSINPQLFTIATLTGHAILAMGENYSVVVDNGPAKKSGVGQKLQSAGDKIGDPFEISTLRREDLKFCRGRCEEEDVVQSGSQPSSRTPRGHQGPAAFLLVASGLNKHGSGDKIPLKYSHLDIAGSAGKLPSPATGAPILALANAFLIKN